MRTLAKKIISDAAVDAGMTVDAVMLNTTVKEILLPKPRLVFEYLSETLKDMPKNVAKFGGGTHRTIRKLRYLTKLQVRAEIVSEDEDWLELFVKKFLLSLPRKTVDEKNNLIVVKADRAVRGGFQSRMVEVFKRRSNALIITFTGMICEDAEVPLIRDVNVRDGITHK